MIGNRIKQARKARGIKRPELAKLTGIPYSTLADIENGRQKGSTQLDIIATKLGVNIDWLRYGRGPMDVENAPEDDAGWKTITGMEQPISLGSGAQAAEYAETHKLKFRAASLSRKGLYAEKLEVYYGDGDSMEPRIKDGDAILVDKSDLIPRDDTIYVIEWKGDYYAKRAEIIDGTVYFRSDNPKGDHNWRKPKRMDNPRDPIIVFGRVRWIGSWED